MADAALTQIIHDGARNAVMKFTNVSDGTGEAAAVKVDVSTLSGNPAEVRIKSIKASTFGMGVNILWEATTDVLVWHIPADMDVNQDFSCFGGLPNNAGAGKSGDIVFTTVGHALGDTYSVVLELIKGS